MQKTSKNPMLDAFVQGLKESPKVFFAPLAPSTWRRYRLLRAGGMGRGASIEAALDTVLEPLVTEQSRG